MGTLLSRVDCNVNGGAMVDKRAPDLIVLEDIL